MPLTRRQALEGLALVGVSGVVSGFGDVADASARARVPRLAILSLRGGLDGVAAVPPYGDDHYRSARRALALGGSEQLILDSRCALHPSLGGLKQFFDRRELLVVQAVGTTSRERSHAGARAAVYGDIDGRTQGWIELIAQAARSPRAPRTPSPLFDTGPSYDTRDLARDLFSANPLIEQALFSGHIGGRDGPIGFAADLDDRDSARFKAAAMRAGRALAAPDGPSIAFLELAGFDTHVAQGTETGRLARTLESLAAGLIVLAKALGPAWRSTAVLVLTEFGRSVVPNRDGGTDHGMASVAFLMGGAVAGGRVVGAWPGLAPERLHHGTDLAPTTDVRAIVRGILIDHLRLPAATVAGTFPGDAEAAPALRLIRT